MVALTFSNSIFFFFFFVFCLVSVSANKPMIRGTSRSDRDSLIYDDQKFTCRDGSKTISFSQVNDDFCDCQDSSDEPGTPACPSGKFWCSNVGYVGKRIFSSKVWDGICDCCDGSDEEGKTECPNTCQELAKEAKKKIEEELTLTKEGVQLKKAAIESSKKELESKRAELEEKKTQLSELNEEKKVAEEKRIAKEEAEKEARRIFEEKKEKANEEGEEGVENPSPSSQEAEVESDEKETEESDEVEDEVEKGDVFSEEGYDDEDDTVRSFKEETKQAKEEEQNIVNKIKEVEGEIKKLETLFKIPFGPQNEFYSLYGKCLSVDTVEYTYELCPFEKVTQKPKKGGASTSLGTWDNDKQTEEWTNEFRIMHYKGGQRCWGGPDRSTVVEVFCGNEEKLADPQEPNKCEYSLKLYTPAACQENHIQALELNLHGDLDHEFES